MTPKQIIPNYKDPVSFRKLAEQDEDFAKVVSKSGAVDWQDAQAVKQLTKSLLKRDFGIQIELPDDRLCPPVPNRFLYIRWIQKLLDSTSTSFTGDYDPDRPVLGIDIGTGASCIYPLLGTASRPNWSFYGTDIDTSSLTSAHKNIILNNLNHRIRLHQSSPAGPIIPLDAISLGPIKQADFTMCNPPFYESKQDMAHSLLRKTLKPNAVCTGAEVEMITEGGELAFARKMLKESLELRGKVQWYTIMFGKLESLVPFVENLKERGCGNWALGVLAPGQLTKRWVVGWSWMGFRPSCKLVRRETDFPTHIGKNIFCHSPSFSIDFAGNDARVVAKHLHVRFNELKGGRSKWKDDSSACLLQTPGDVWSRRARRKQKALEMGGNTAHAPSPPDHAGSEEQQEERFVVRVDVEEARVAVNWLFGLDYVLFESFCGFVKRQLEGFSANPNKIVSTDDRESRDPHREDVDMGMD